ncbi:cytochrome c oxidase subunit II [Virgibacillus pantothenticus]|uniref:cytochrome c oxidase subunit II n=1 Tax=Virgibacillus pantothenticus TaxID=1473 RepID=UPI001BCD1C9B|nr:cytochrome c oxidase subunit II [Virgibacillus pantothenticus]
MKKIFLLPLLLLLTGCNITVLEPKSETASEQAFLITFSFWIMMIVVVTVFILFARFVWKYRYTDSRKHDLPKDVKGNIKLEITWIIIPVLLLIILAVPTLAITYDQSPEWTKESDDTGVAIDVTGKQFNWMFRHKNGKEEMDKLVIPEGESIILNLRSEDVIHSFWVPELGGKVDVMPGKELTYEIKHPQRGMYQGKCAEYCGLGHADMTFKVEVVSKQAYAQYLHQ